MRIVGKSYDREELEKATAPHIPPQMERGEVGINGNAGGYFLTSGKIAVYEEEKWVGWALLEAGDTVREREIPYQYGGDVGKWPAGLMPAGRGVAPRCPHPLGISAAEWREIVRAGDEVSVQEAKDLVGWGNRGVAWSHAKQGELGNIRWICIIGYEGRGGSNSSRAYHLFHDACGKKIYADAATAQEDADALAARLYDEGTDKLMAVYWCDKCTGYHVGTQEERPRVAGRAPLHA